MRKTRMPNSFLTVRALESRTFSNGFLVILSFCRVSRCQKLVSVHHLKIQRFDCKTGEKFENMEVDHQEEEMESLNEEATYVPKCCIFDRTKLNTSSRLLMPETEDDGEFSDEDNNSVFRDSAERPAKIRASASAARKSRYNSNNLSYRNPTNKLPTSSPYHLSRHHSPNPAPSNDLNDLDACTDQEQVRDEQQQRDHGLAGLGGLSQDLSRCLDLSEEDEGMIRLAGGQAVADRILAECEARVMRTPNPEITLMPSPRGGETILMQRCCRNYPESDVRSWQTTYGEIRAYARIMARLRPDLLTTRQQNNQVCTLKCSPLSGFMNLLSKLSR